MVRRSRCLPRNPRHRPRHRRVCRLTPTPRLLSPTSLDQRFEQIDKRFEQVDKRFEQVDQRFEQINERFDKMDQRFGQIDDRFNVLNQRLDGIENALRRQLQWSVGTIALFGTIITVLIAVAEFAG